MNKIYVFLFTILAYTSSAQIEYTGDNLLMVLGKNKTSYDFKEFKTYWLLDSKLESNYGGVKILLNTTTQTADTLLIAGVDFTYNGTKFYPYSSKLPWGIKMKDKYSEMSAKTSAGLKVAQGYLFEFVGYSMLVSYNSNFQIRWMKIFTNQKQLEVKISDKPAIVENKIFNIEPVKPVVAEKREDVSKAKAAAVEVKPVDVAQHPKQEEIKTPVKAEVVSAQPKLTESAKQPEPARTEIKVEVIKEVVPEPVRPATPDVVPVVKETVSEKVKDTTVTTLNVTPSVKADVVHKPAPVKDTVKLVNRTPFNMAIMNVFFAYDESSFESVKGQKLDTANFWGYKFAFKSKLKIPGEKYSIVYCYPHESSSEDFKTVLREGNFDSSFGSGYSEMEMRLRQNLTFEEGWRAVNLPSNGKPINPIEFKNPKYGSVILDYAKNPKGQHMLLLRYTFLVD